MTSGSKIAARRAALAQLDNARFSWQHVRVILIAGVGFFTDAYDIFAVNFAENFVGHVYFGGSVPSNLDTAIKISTSAGTVIGQVVMGALADVIGRKKMYGIELIILIIATLGLSVAGHGPALAIGGVTIFWRVVMGIAIGADYPLSSIIMSEFASVKWRGAMMGAVFANQGWGQFTCALLTFILVVGYKGDIRASSAIDTCTGDCVTACDKIWRLIYGIGAVPALFALYFRLTIPETIRYTLDVDHDEKHGVDDVHKYMGTHDRTEVAQAPTHLYDETLMQEPPKASLGDFVRHFSQWRHGKVLFGTMFSWFFLDVAFYGLGLNSSIILGAIGYSTPKDKDLYQTFYNNAVGNLILSVAGLIPGYWVSVATVDTLGRRTIQGASFLILTVLFCIWGFGYHKISTNGMFAIYCLCNFFQNFGPNTTTFIIPGECFPTRYRSTAHGLSAGCGKVGAIIAQSLIGPLWNRGGKNKWLNHVMEIFALFMLCGVFTTMLVPETKRKTLEELSGDHPPALERANKDSDSDVPAAAQENVVARRKETV